MPIDGTGLTIFSTATSKRTQLRVANPAWAAPLAVDPVLVASGWTRAGVLRPYIWVWIQFLFDVTTAGTGPLATVTADQRPARFIYNSGSGAAVYFRFYDPYRESPVSAPGTAWVPMGTTEAGSIGNLAASVAANTPFSLFTIISGTATYTTDCGDVISQPRDVGTSIVFVTPGGPELNGVPTTWTNQWGVAGLSGGGGYRERSQASNAGTAIQLEFWTSQNDPAHIRYRATAVQGGSPIGGGIAFAKPDAVNPPAAGYRFTALVDAYGCAIFIEAADGGGSGDAGSFLVSAPNVIADSTGLGPFAFLIYSGDHAPIRTSLAWPFCATAYGSGFSGGQVAAQPRMLGPHYNGAVVQIAPYEPLVTTAWVAFAQYGNQPGRVVGVLPDCIMVARNYPLDARLMFQGKRYTMIATQSTSTFFGLVQEGVGTLFWCEE